MGSDGTSALFDRAMDASTPFEKLNETMLTQTGKMKANLKTGEWSIQSSAGVQLPQPRCISSDAGAGLG